MDLFMGFSLSRGVVLIPLVDRGLIQLGQGQDIIEQGLGVVGLGLEGHLGGADIQVGGQALGVIQLGDADASWACSRFPGRAGIPGLVQVQDGL
jgi:hypothetical protein